MSRKLENLMNQPVGPKLCCHHEHSCRTFARSCELPKHPASPVRPVMTLRWAGSGRTIYQASCHSRNCVKYIHASMLLLMLLLLPRIPFAYFSIWIKSMHPSNSAQMSAFFMKLLHLLSPISTNSFCSVNASLLLLCCSLTWLKSPYHGTYSSGPNLYSVSYQTLRSSRSEDVPNSSCALNTQHSAWHTALALKPLLNE